MNAPVVMWHRRDLRLHDNRALAAACAQDRPVISVFVLDPGILSRPDTAPARVSYMLDALQNLADSYAQIGGRLILQKGDPVHILPTVAQALGACQVVWNQDIEPYALRRDAAVTAALADVGIPSQSYQDMLLHGPEEIRTQSGSVYSVFTPFWRNWVSLPKQDPWPRPEQILATNNLDEWDRGIPSLQDLGLTCDQDLSPAGETAALDLLEDFCQGSRILSYQEQRNIPSQPGTSGLSPHLRWGTLGIRQVWQASVEAEAEVRSDEAEASLTTWRQELCWREFYKHALTHWPHLETQCFRPAFDSMEWENNTGHFQAWCEGRTGYPIVDAAMHQLNQTGWMHNRCRMIVASFLTKDLLIDWRWGEQYFMQKLVDGDLAANNGGWQWSASVGTDPKPMRIFNPSTQSVKFDPEGDYIRHYLPELSSLDTWALLDVSDSKKGIQAQRQRRYCGYPDPIVDHKLQQKLFKQRYQACR